MTIFKEPKKKPPKTSLDDDQKRQLGESKVLIVVAATVACFVIGGGWRLVWPNAINEQFHMATSMSAQCTAWLQFAMFFGFVPAMGGFIISAALIDHFSHSKGNR
jgi:hypothetical protein